VAGGTGGAAVCGEVALTPSMIYALYCAAYGEAVLRYDRPGEALSMADVARGLTPLEWVIVQLALHDLTNGTPLRSRPHFDRAVRDGATLLRSLGLELAQGEEGLGPTDNVGVAA